MLRIQEAIVVEGRFDKNTLAQIVDTLILETGGFAIFQDKEKRQLLRRIAKAQGLLVLTDSDSAGFLIRNHLKGIIPHAHLKHAYIPDITAKERRKRRGSKEGKLGVEGMKKEILLKAILQAGATVCEAGPHSEGAPRRTVTKKDLYADGFSGRPESARRRQALLHALDLPARMTANGLLGVLNLLFTYDEYQEAARKAAADADADAQGAGRRPGP